MNGRRSRHSPCLEVSRFGPIFEIANLDVHSRGSCDPTLRNRKEELAKRLPIGKEIPNREGTGQGRVFIIFRVSCAIKEKESGAGSARKADWGTCDREKNDLSLGWGRKTLVMSPSQGRGEEQTTGAERKARGGPKEKKS